MSHAANKKTILLVEDEFLVARYQARQLEPAGYTVVHACSGEQAIQQVQAAPHGIDLILMDINLGAGLDGTQAAQIILKEHDIPIVFLSAHTEPEIVAKTEKITSYGYVVKDSGSTVLDASIKMAFKLHAARQEILAHSREIEAVNRALRQECNQLAQEQGPDKFADLRRQAEQTLRGETLKAFGETLKVSEQAERMMHELRVHQIELEMQNEELRRAQAELAASRDRYLELYDFAPVGYFTLDENGAILEANLTGAGLLGVERSRLIGQPLARFVAAQDRDSFHAFHRQLCQANARQTVELEIDRQEGPPFYACLEGAAVDPHTNLNGGGCRSRLALSDITARKQAEEQLRRLAAQREWLVRDTYHRVKNNLMVVESLLSLQSHAIQDPAVCDLFTESRTRVKTMLRIHETLHQSADLTRIEFAGYISKLIRDLLSAYKPAQVVIEPVIDIENIFLTADTATSCGMICNELISNALKHGFKDRARGRLSVTLKQESGQYVLTVSDDGVGVPAAWTGSTLTRWGCKLWR